MTIEDAKQIAHGLIQGYIGPDHRVMDMPSFYSAVAQALHAACQKGWNDCAAAQVGATGSPPLTVEGGPTVSPQTRRRSLGAIGA